MRRLISKILIKFLYFLCRKDKCKTEFNYIKKILNDKKIYNKHYIFIYCCIRYFIHKGYFTIVQKKALEGIILHG